MLQFVVVVVVVDDGAKCETRVEKPYENMPVKPIPAHLCVCACAISAKKNETLGVAFRSFV